MGRAVKTILPIAAIAGIGFATGGFGFGAAAPVLAPLGTGAPHITAGVAAANAANAGGGFFASLSGSKALSLAFSGLGALSSLVAGNQSARDAELRAIEERRGQRLAELEAKQTEAAALEQHRLARGAAIAKAAAQGQNIDNSRSFMAFLDDQEQQVDRDIRNVKANAEFGAVSSRIRIRAFNTSARTSRVAGILGAGRSLIGAAQRA